VHWIFAYELTCFETTVWLEIIAESSVLLAENLVAIVAENRELCRIIAASIKTARASGSSDKS